MNRNKLIVPSAFAAGLVAVMPITAVADQMPAEQRVSCLTQTESSTKSSSSETKEARRCCAKRYKGFCVKWVRCGSSNCVASVRG